MLPILQLAPALATAKLASAHGPWSRAIGYRYLLRPPPGLTGTWVTTPHPPTQLLGQLAYDSGRIVGIKYASAKHQGGLNLVVFPDRMAVAVGNYLDVYDPDGNLSQRLGP